MHSGFLFAAGKSLGVRFGPISRWKYFRQRKCFLTSGYMEISRFL